MVLPLLLFAQGMVITQSTTLAPGTYATPIIIRGDSITVDFRAATLQGTDTAIIVDGGTRIGIVHAKVHGHKIGILARGTRGLTLIDSDLSDNWRPRLFSLVEHESLVDWLSFHRNENREWMRFGAAIYLEDVKGGEVRGNTVVRGMNALLMVRSDSLHVHDNNFSFNSGLGIGLYRSSDNRIIHNRLDYNVRGYSHGFYTRGQDSAGLLLYEQSSRNYVFGNSITHGGDGVFLWAGQTTMDSGTGGANDNMFMSNDVSYATANGIEATFSRNQIIGNKAWGSQYGVWAGYSYETSIRGNNFRNNRTAIAIEHGQDNTIVANSFDGDSIAIRLWADSITASDWGYPTHRDTRSRDYRITGNTCKQIRTVLRIRNTSGVDSTDACTAIGTTAFLDTRNRQRPPWPSTPLSERDRSAIIVDEWGPYDYTTPKLWPAGDSTRAVPLRLVTLGPAGGWKVVAKRGIAVITAESGRIGDTIALAAFPDSIGDWSLTLESRGRRFSYERFEPPISWEVRFADSVRTWPRLDLMRYGPNNWSLEATGSVTLVEGSYSIRTISDDAIRVWVDGTLVIDAWTPHESRVDYAPLAPGKHELRVEYRQVDGWVELRLDIIRGSDR
jgi:parallel beta-helix repeat protein